MTCLVHRPTNSLLKVRSRCWSPRPIPNDDIGTRWPLRLGAALLLFMIGAGIAFQAVRFGQNRPYREFVSELDFIENIEHYAEIDDIEFLEKLADQDVFGEDLSDDQ